MFLAGKGLTAPLNFIILLIIAARLPSPEFALYAWLLAFGRFSQQLSYVGVNWIALHQVPYYRSRVGGRAYRWFMLGLVGLRFALIAALVGICFFTAAHLAVAFGHEAWARPLRLYLAVMAAELGAEFLRSCIFEPLLEQGAVQANMLLQHSVFLTGLLLLSTEGPSLSIEHVLYARGAAVWMAVLVALGLLGYMLRQPAPTTSDPPPRLRFLLRFALDNYAQDVMRQTSGAPLMTMLASRLIDVPALAVFGFAQNLVGFVDRFLPAQLFLGLLRPRVIAAYVDDGSFGELQRRIGLILKVSSCTLAAVAAVLVASGRPALDLLAGGRYSSSYGLLLAFLLWLAILSVQRMQSVLTNVLGRSELLRRASLSSLLVVPTAIVLISLGAGAYGLVLGMIAGEAVSVWLISRQLRRTGFGLVFDAPGYGRIAVATAVAVLLGKLSALPVPAGLWGAGSGIAATLVSFVLALRFLSPFPPEERRAIENLLGRKLILL